MTLQGKCFLADRCKKAGLESDCNHYCLAYIKLHGNYGKDGGFLRNSGVPFEYQNVMAKSLPFKKENPKAYELIYQYCNNVLDMVKGGIGLYLYSVPSQINPMGTGTGKTTAAAAIINEYVCARLVDSIKSRKPIFESPAMFVNVADLQSLFNDMYRGNRQLSERAGTEYLLMRDGMVKTEILTLDEIGLREASESFMSELYTVINKRVSRKAATLYTSNVPLNELSRLIGDRIVSRIHAYNTEVLFTGHDMRKGGI